MGRGFLIFIYHWKPSPISLPALLVLFSCHRGFIHLFLFLTYHVLGMRNAHFPFRKAFMHAHYSWWPKTAQLFWLVLENGHENKITDMREIKHLYAYLDNHFWRLEETDNFLPNSFQNWPHKWNTRREDENENEERMKFWRASTQQVAGAVTARTHWT